MADCCNDVDRIKAEYKAKNLSQRHFFHHKSRMFTKLGSNMGLRRERLATTRLNHSTAQ